MKINNLKDFNTSPEKINNLNDFITSSGVSGYDSPIRMILGEVEAKMEAETMSVIQSYGIDVDKDELIKALAYDRKHYDCGYAEGYAKGYQTAKNDLIKFFNDNF